VLLVSWNVNSLRARLARVEELLGKHAPDVVALQETKTAPDQFPHLELQALGYRAVDHSGGRWAGVALLVRDDHEATDVQVGLPGSPVPDEARWVEAVVDGVRVVSTYVVNGRTLDDPQYALKLAFLERVRERVVALRAPGVADVPLAVLGDVNVAPRDQDVWDVEAVHGGTHVSVEEREAVTRIGLFDAWLAAPETGPERFTWWDYRAGAFHKDHGMRIDLALVDDRVVDRLAFVGIDRDLRKGTKPSDHAPLLVRLAD
jgi:exodeoxyribonuclease-3